MKVYIAGKVSGLEPSVFHYKFDKCRDDIRKHLLGGTEIIVPTDLCDDDWGWEKCMEVCLETLKTCDLMVVMDDWQTSKGATKEVETAMDHNIPIWFL